MDPPRATAATRARLLDELRRCEVDLDAARQRVEAQLRAHRRRRRALLGSSAAAMLALVVTATVLAGGEDPDDVVADRSLPTTSTSTSTTTTAPGPAATSPEVVDEEGPPPETVPEVPLAQPATTPEPAPAPSTTVPTSTVTTIPGNRPMQARLEVLTPRVSAGSTTVVQVRWSDRDHSGVRPSYTVDWGDPAVAAAPAPAPPSTGCDAPGGPAEDVDRLEFRHATTGRRVIRVEGVTCAGGAPFAERFVLEGVVEVLEPEVQGAPGRAVVLHRDPGEGSRLLLPALDAATAVHTTPEGATTVLGARSPVLSQRVDGAPATVVVVPLGSTGVVELGWPSTSCRASAEVDPTAAPPGSAPRAPLRASC